MRKVDDENFDIDVMTIKELRIVAKNLKISSKGSKAVLITRIKETIKSKD